MKTCEAPSTEVERNSSIPLIVFTAPSTLSVTSVSISWGEAPGLITVTVIVGKSILGNRSTPSALKENNPTTVRLRIIIVAKTGRWTQISASFCIAFPWSARILRAVREHPCSKFLFTLSFSIHH